MSNGRIREVYPGGNTSLGFYSYYENIIGPDATRIIIIKGGPGVGKSSFMKGLAVELNERGFDVELHHCSSDNNSLDGVVFPQVKVALIDGTSPHIVDPKNPGAVDEIIHLGDYWDERGLRREKSQVIAANREVGVLFRRGYRYLKSARELRDDLASIFSENLDYGLANQKAADLIAAIFEGRPVASRPGKLRKLFASAITPEGCRNFLGSLFDPLMTVYAVTGEPGTGKATLLNKLAAAGLERGFDCEGYYCAFDPLKLEHLIIPGLETAVTTAVEPHCYDSSKWAAVFRMDEGADPNVISHNQAAIQSDRELFSELLDKAIGSINQAKAVHDRMEQSYIPNMDFAAISELRQKTLERILAYAEEQETWKE